jgi:hypothetical protein
MTEMRNRPRARVLREVYSTPDGPFDRAAVRAGAVQRGDHIDEDDLFEDLEDRDLLDGHLLSLERYPYWSVKTGFRFRTNRAFCQTINDELLPFLLRVHPPGVFLLVGGQNDDLLDPPIAASPIAWESAAVLRPPSEGIERCVHLSAARVDFNTGTSIPAARCRWLGSGWPTNVWPAEYPFVGRLLRELLAGISPREALERSARGDLV